MKFDFAIGNPPYQEEAQGENNTVNPAVYNQFLDAAFLISDHVELIHPARFLFNAGTTPAAWNRKMLDDPHFKILQYEPDSSKVFRGISLPGGVAVSYRDANSFFGAIEVFSQHEQLNSIRSKVINASDYRSIEDSVFLQTKFDLGSLYKAYPEAKSVIGSNGRDRRFRNNVFVKLPFLFSDESSSQDDVRIIGVVGARRIWKYISRRFVDVSSSNIDKYTVLTSAADGAAGTIGNPIPARITGAPTILSPGEGMTQTFQSIGSFDLFEEAQNAKKYMQSKFMRAMVSILKVTQHLAPSVYRYVPIQDFTSSSDIDWSKSIPEIDQQLYAKYNLSPEEIEFIESHVKEMN